jgi:hypothetical protein
VPATRAHRAFLGHVVDAASSDAPHSLCFSSRLTITSRRSNRDDGPVNVIHKEVTAGVDVVRFNVLKISVECLAIGCVARTT